MSIDTTDVKRKPLRPAEDCGPILIVEDEPAFARILRKRLESNGFQVIAATDGQEGLALAKKHQPDVILSDWMMPRMTGVEMCGAIRACPELEGVYIIMLSNKADSNQRVLGFDQGADDYLLKTCDSGELLARIGAGMRIRRLQKELMRRAQIDGMTELYNRTYFFRKIEEELSRSSRYEHSTTLCMVDLNDFKHINDDHGHLAGDAAILRVAEVLRLNCRNTDVVARYGGDEFGILFVESDKATAEKVMRRIQSQLATESFNFEELSLSVNLSYGLAEARSEAIPNPDALVAEADERLYDMKKQKNQKTELPS
ncbi:MAG: two-component system cell cycle response regulator [Planctomycetota bacterium]|jgi:two-component system cell cycle response regulator